jgi:hypothetical protein
MALTARERQQLEEWLHEVTRRLTQVEDPDEEMRLLNEQLYLSGALAALDAVDGKNMRLLKVLKRSRT